LVLVLLLAAPAQAVPPGWGPGGAMTGRDWHTATLLKDGSVLVAGGYVVSNGTVTNSAQRYIPATNTWEPAGQLVAARAQHVAALLDDGRVLVAGGRGNPGDITLASAELYDPATNRWTGVGNLNVARRMATATTLPNGTVLVAGGHTSPVGQAAPTNTTELFNPATTSFTNGKSMGVARSFHAATRYANGDVLMSGGYNGLAPENGIARTTELYEAATGNFVPKASMGIPRAIHEATLLADGRVLVTGGGDGNVHLATFQIYTPATNSWGTTGTMLRAHNYHAAVLLHNGKVLAVGGVNAGGVPDQPAGLYDPATNTWSLAGNTSAARSALAATLLPTGRVLVSSGYNGAYLPSAELWTPSTTLLADPAVSFDDLTPGAAGGAVASVKNTGDSPLLPSGFALAGGFPGDYAITDDKCTGATVLPGATCTVGLRFTPGAAGARGATLTFEANTPALTHAISLFGRGIAPAAQPAPPPPVVVPNTLQKIVVTLAYKYDDVTAKSTRLGNLVVKGVPAGSTITVSCRKGCLKKSLTKRNVRGNVALGGLVSARRTVKVGTQIVVTVSHPNMISAIKTLIVRKKKAPQVTTRCQAPGQAKPTAC
jgi:N-acetylneuraminic acid mutarotase